MKTRHIIIVDDDDDDRLLLSEMINRVDQNIVIYEARSVKQLLELLDFPLRPYPDTLLLDINMPGMDGFHCLAELESRPALYKIVLTTSSDWDCIDRCYQSGAHFFATKPVTYKGLKSLAETILDLDWVSYSFPVDRKMFVIK